MQEAAADTDSSKRATAVRPGLYLGGMGSWNNCNITHILGIGTDAPIEEYPAGTTHMFIELEDDEDANLIQYLEKCCAYIDEAVSAPGGAVLIHCHAGVSRSAAVIVAYLVKSEGMGVSGALENLRKIHPAACPNDGFFEQLLLFQHMGYLDAIILKLVNAAAYSNRQRTAFPELIDFCFALAIGSYSCVLDLRNEAYKRFNLQQLGKRWEEYGFVEGQQLKEVGDEAVLASLERYRCKKCRTVVASATHVIPIEEGPGQGAFPFHKREKGKGTPSLGKETSLFLEPLQWMADEIMAPTGKLYCPKCKERLGSFNWAGTQSNSGRWVTPSFQLHMCKLDILSPALDLKLHGTIRKPHTEPF